MILKSFDLLDFVQHLLEKKLEKMLQELIVVMIVYLDMNQQPSARSPLSDLVRAVASINHL